MSPGPTVFYLIGRSLSALMWMGTILLLYLLGKRMYRPRAGRSGRPASHLRPGPRPDLARHAPRRPRWSFSSSCLYLFIWNIAEKGRTGDYLLGRRGRRAGHDHEIRRPADVSPSFHRPCLPVRETKRPRREIFFSPRSIGAGLDLSGRLHSRQSLYRPEFPEVPRSDFRWQSSHLVTVGHTSAILDEQAPLLFYLKHGFRENVGLARPVSRPRRGRPRIHPPPKTGPHSPLLSRRSFPPDRHLEGPGDPLSFAHGPVLHPGRRGFSRRRTPLDRPKIAQAGAEPKRRVGLRRRCRRSRRRDPLPFGSASSADSTPPWPRPIPGPVAKDWIDLQYLPGHEDRPGITTARRFPGSDIRPLPSRPEARSTWNGCRSKTSNMPSLADTMSERFIRYPRDFPKEAEFYRSLDREGRSRQDVRAALPGPLLEIHFVRRSGSTG